jgi:AcrR family transcriptional regulator
VLERALALADGGGLEHLTMRALADGLGVVPMAIYKHVSNKDDLIEGMIDLVWSEVALPDSADGWRSAMRSRCVSLREALLRHRWAIGLMESGMRPGPQNLRQHDSMMGCLRRSGFSFRNTVHAVSTLDAYVYGFTLQERTLPFDSPEQSGEVVEAKRALQPESAALEYPYLLEVAVELGRSGYDFGIEFETGLDLILDGIEQLRPEWRS